MQLIYKEKLRQIIETCDYGHCVLSMNNASNCDTWMLGADNIVVNLITKCGANGGPSPFFFLEIE